VRRLSTILTAAAALALPAAASAAPYLPPPGKVFAGVGAGTGAGDFDAQVGHHSPVFQSFVSYGYTGAEWAFTRPQATGARVMLHISTIAAGNPEVITPGAIARGRGDAYLLWLNRRMAEAGAPVYVRLFAEMDNYRNPYCAFDGSGRSRGADRSTAAFRSAWRRVTLVLRGGDVATIDARLRKLRLPRLRTASATLPTPKVAMMWVPMVAGAPDTRANAPAAYWPGRAYVDWVGTDFYSKFPNFSGLDRFAAGRQWRGLPFVFGEWALWGSDDPGFVHRFFGWVRSHRQVRMLVYNQGFQADGPFRLRHYPRALAALRAELRRPAFR
jgi:hypothetical protein